MRIAWIFLLLLAFAPVIAAQQDPLSATFKPAMDTTCTDYPSNVWVSGPLWKIRQDAGTAPTCTNGMVENGKWGTFFGTQNEFVDFQVHWHDTGSTTVGLKVTVSNFAQTVPNPSTISCATGIGEKCIMYREQYMHITFPDCTGSPAGYCYNVPGFYPDILEPAVDPYLGQTTNAFPFTVAANQNQSMWVDVLIPPAAPSGYYSGTVTVQTGCPGACTTVATLPITIGVWEWPGAGSMPSKPTLKSYFAQPWFSQQCKAFFGSTSCAGYPINGTPGFNADAATTAAALDECITLMDHRVGCNGESDQYSVAGVYGTTANFTSTYSPILNGTSTSPHPLTLLSGAATNSWNWSAAGIPTPTQQQTAATLFSTNSWFPKMFYYYCDETACSAATLVSTGNTIHSQSTPIMPTFTTKTGITTVASQGALNAVDIIVADIRFDDPPSAYTSWLAGNCCGAGSPPRQTWGYQTCDDGAGPCTNGQTGTGTFPGYSTDNTPATNQAMEWFSYKNGKSGELYFAVSICPAQPGGQLCGQGGFPASTGDPTVSNYHQGMWGDGTMLYEVPASKWGVTTPIFIPSMRLKYVRDGMQNYEYMNVLRQNGKDASVVQPAINSWITNVTTVNWNSTAPAFGFTSDLQDARIVLGNAMHALSFAAPWSGIIDPSRAIDWTQAGVVGGIPSAGFTACPAGPIAAYTGSVSTLNSAISTCPANTYLQLGAGTFNFTDATNAGILINGKNHFALRGAGPGSTETIVKSNNPQGCTGYNADVCIIDSTSTPTSATTANAHWGGSATALWTAGYTSGSTSITLTNVGNNGGGIHVGQYITLDQASSPMAAAGFVNCSQYWPLGNACSLGGSPVNTRQEPFNYGAYTGVADLVGTTLTPRCGNQSTICPLSTTGTIPNMPIVMYQPTSTSATPSFATVVSNTATAFTISAAPATGDGAYTYTVMAGAVTVTGTSAVVVPSTTAFPAGFVGASFLLFKNNVLYLGNVTAEPDTSHVTLRVPPGGGDGIYSYTGVPYATQQLVQVTAMTGTGCSGSPAVCTGAGPFTVTITPGLYGQEWNANNGPGAWFAATPTSGYVGIENMTLDHSQSIQTGANVVGIALVNTSNSWVTGVRSIRPHRNHIWFVNTTHDTIQSNYLYDSFNAATQSYGFEVTGGHDTLIANNICQHITACIIGGVGEGNVEIHNFNYDGFVDESSPLVPGPGSTTSLTITNTSQSGAVKTYTYTPAATPVVGVPISIAGTTNGGGSFNFDNVLFTGTSSTTFTITCGTQAVCTSGTVISAAENGIAFPSNGVLSTMFVEHDSNNRYNLHEGNIGSGDYFDFFHGNADAITSFRNYYTGYELNKTSARIPMKYTGLNRYSNNVANVVGDVGHGTGSYQNYPGCSSGCTSEPAFSLAPISGTTSPVAPPGTVLADSLVKSTTLFWGNYDTFTANTRWCGNSSDTGWSTTCASTSEIPTADAFGYANPVPTVGDVTATPPQPALPASFYYLSAPAYNTCPWSSGCPVPFKAIGPDVTGGTALSPDMTGAKTPPGGHAYDNSASLCWQNSPIDSSYVGFDGGVRLFNAANCYGTVSPVNPAAVLSPNPLAFGNQNVNTTSAVQFATLANIGTVNLNVTATSVTGNFTRSGGTCPAGAFTLPPTTGNTCTIGVTFSPNATGPFTGTISVTSNAVPSPTVANLTGTGTQATITWSSPQGGTAYNFGNIPVSSSINSSNLTLTNNGNGPLTVSVASSDTTHFSIVSTTCSSPLASFASCVYVVKFTATSATTFTANLTETDSNASNSPQSLTMSGSGFIPVVNPVVPWPAIIIQ